VREEISDQLSGIRSITEASLTKIGKTIDSHTNSLRSLGQKQAQLSTDMKAQVQSINRRIDLEVGITGPEVKALRKEVTALKTAVQKSDRAHASLRAQLQQLNDKTTREKRRRSSIGSSCSAPLSATRPRRSSAPRAAPATRTWGSRGTPGPPSRVHFVVGSTEASEVAGDGEEDDGTEPEEEVDGGGVMEAEERAEVAGVEEEADRLDAEVVEEELFGGEDGEPAGESEAVVDDGAGAVPPTSPSPAKPKRANPRAKRARSV
jgi:hypothetical protein